MSRPEGTGPGGTDALRHTHPIRARPARRHRSDHRGCHAGRGRRPAGRRRTAFRGGPGHPGFIDCGDYLIDYHVEVFRTITEFYDADGNLVRAHFDIHYQGTLTNAETGLVARDDGSRMFIDDYVAMTSTLVRGSHHVTVPGYGIVFGETGRVVWDWNGTTPDENEDDDFELFRSGLHGDPADVCDAMR